MKIMAKAAFAGALSVALFSSASAQEALMPGSWEGAYYTAFVGGIYQQTEFFDDYYNNDFTGHSGGGLGGIGIGYNIQQGNWVYGLEADIAGVYSETSITADGGDYSGDRWEAKSQINAIATLRARMGIDVGGSLYYVTGGFAAAYVRNRGEWPEYTNNSYDASSDEWIYGITGGGGFERQLGNGTALRVEGLVADFNDAFANDSYNYDYEFDNVVVMARIALVSRF